MCDGRSAAHSLDATDASTCGSEGAEDDVDTDRNRSPRGELGEAADARPPSMRRLDSSGRRLPVRPPPFRAMQRTTLLQRVGGAASPLGRLLYTPIVSSAEAEGEGTGPSTASQSAERGARGGPRERARALQYRCERTVPSRRERVLAAVANVRSGGARGIGVLAMTSERLLFIDAQWVQQRRMARTLSLVTQRTVRVLDDL